MLAVIKNGVRVIVKISEVEKQILKESEEVSIQNILKEFRLLTNDLEHLLYPSLLESEGEESSDEMFEEDFETFRIRFRNISRLTAAFIRELKKNEKEQKGILDTGYVKKLDDETQKVFEFYQEQMQKRVERKTIVKIQNAFYAYIQLAKVINLTLKEYNKNYKPEFPLLKNIPEPSDLGIFVDLETYFQQWIGNLNSLF